METKTFNINHHVYVELTSKGKAIWEKEHNKYASKDYPFKEKYNRSTKNGWTEFQMHELISLFGSHLSDNFDLPFSTSIRFNETDLN